MTTWQAVGEQVADGELLRCVGCGLPVFVPDWRRRLVPNATGTLCGQCKRAHQERREGR